PPWPAPRSVHAGVVRSRRGPVAPAGSELRSCTHRGTRHTLKISVYRKRISAHRWLKFQRYGNGDGFVVPSPFRTNTAPGPGNGYCCFMLPLPSPERSDPNRRAERRAPGEEVLCRACGRPVAETIRSVCRCIPPEIWRLPEMRHAWEARDVSTVIRLVRWNTDLSLMALVKLT